MTSPPLEVLWLAGDTFEPLNAGLYKYSKAVADSLAADGVEIRYIGRQRDDAPRPPGWNVLDAQPRHRLVRNIAMGRPLKIAAIAGPDYLRAVHKACVERTPDVVIVDHLRGAAGLAAVPDDIPVVYCSQNHEISVRAAAIDSTSLGLQNLAYRIDGVPMGAWERRLVDRASLVTVIAPDDIERFMVGHDIESDRLQLLPPPYGGEIVRSRSITSSTPRRICIVTDLRWSLKRHNLDDFLEGALPTLRAHGIDVVLAGLGTDDFADDKPGVDGLGFVEDLGALLADCRFGVSFEPRGGGLKMKVLDYVFHRVPVLAGPDDLAGFPLVPRTSALQASTAESLAQQCAEAIDDLDLLERLHDRAFTDCSAEFTGGQIGSRFHHRLRRLVG